jgi:hypothetical protein
MARYEVPSYAIETSFPDLEISAGSTRDCSTSTGRVTRGKMVSILKRNGPPQRLKVLKNQLVACEAREMEAKAVLAKVERDDEIRRRSKRLSRYETALDHGRRSFAHLNSGTSIQKNTKLDHSYEVLPSLIKLTTDKSKKPAWNVWKVKRT